MNVLIACEESQTVCKAFREKGHNAFSCDIQDCSGGHPEWHIKQDVLPLLNGNCIFKTVTGEEYKISDKWDMIIAFPPCTDLAVSGARHFERKRTDGSQKKSIEFFCQFFNADCDKISIENPINIIGGKYIYKHFSDLCLKYNLPKKCTQIIQPWYFGDNFQKTTCLWLKGLNPLIQENNIKPEFKYKEWFDERTQTYKREFLDMYKISCLGPGKRGKQASKTFPGIAAAMAEQWG